MCFSGSLWEGEVEEDQLEPFGLKQSFTASQSLFLGSGANPEQTLEVAACSDSGDRIEGIRQIDPGRESAPLQALGEQAQGQGGSTRGGGTTDLAEAAEGKTATQTDIE